MQSHTRVFLRDRAFAPLAYVTYERPKRLIVFVHGFLGHPVRTWKGIDDFDAADDFWRFADMLFVRYDSFADSIKGVADRIRRNLANYYPYALQEIDPFRRDVADQAARSSYDEIYLVGHSLGGLVARKAVLDAVAAWVNYDRDRKQQRPPLLDAHMRFFSPASAGYRPAGLMTILDALDSGVGVMRFSASYQDIQEDSVFLRSTRASTERLSADVDGSGLRARTLWANPENVVNTIDYDSDAYSQSADDQTHRSVCKPTAGYQLPWLFIANGEI